MWPGGPHPRSACARASHHRRAPLQAAAKRALRQRMNLCQSDAPIIGVVTRLTHQKGIHLIKHAAWRTVERGGQFVLLGSAPDPSVQNDFAALADQLSHQHNENARLCFAFDEPLSHLIYAGCDLMLVPSMFEPCGLTQMIGMRYGTVPVVRKTGGLADTVFDIDHDVPRAEEYGMQARPLCYDVSALARRLTRGVAPFCVASHAMAAWPASLGARCRQHALSWADVAQREPRGACACTAAKVHSGAPFYLGPRVSMRLRRSRRRCPVVICAAVSWPVVVYFFLTRRRHRRAHIVRAHAGERLQFRGHGQRRPRLRHEPRH